jgi:hypothetical protein
MMDAAASHHPSCVGVIAHYPRAEDQVLLERLDTAKGSRLAEGAHRHHFQFSSYMTLLQYTHIYLHPHT